MPACNYCGIHLEANPGTHLATCPRCGRALAEEAGGQLQWVDVAKLTSLAEAGFLSDELNGSDIDARVHQAEDFSELHGGRKTHYLIRVPAASAQEAATRIRSYIVDTEGDQDAGDEYGYRGDVGQFDGASWRPVALVVLAGVASFALGRQTAAPRVEPRPATDSLPAAAGEIGRAFVTEAEPGAPRHRLSFDRSRRMWRLDTDANGDGVFDVQRQFTAAGAAR
jgi:hypothetical protein